MTTIVMNTANAAVTEYDWDFQSITSTHAGSTDGLVLLGGADDAGAAIDSRFMGPKVLLGAGRRANIDFVYFAMREGSGTGVLRVAGTDTWEYEFPIQRSGVSRAKPGQGIRENYLALGFRNHNGGSWRIDKVDADVKAAPQRRSGQ